MKKSDIEKMRALQDNNFAGWLKARQEAWDELSEKHSMFCVCGRLCTGLHEQNCRRFQDDVTLKTIKRLEVE